MGPLARVRLRPGPNRLIVPAGVAELRDAERATWCPQARPGRPPGDRPTHRPDAHFGAAAAYDPVGSRLFLKGGAAGEAGPMLADTWVLAPTGSELGVARLEPSGPCRRRAVREPESRRSSGRLVLFGGRDAEVEHS
jgi:hypothetical protein